MGIEGHDGPRTVLIAQHMVWPTLREQFDRQRQYEREQDAGALFRRIEDPDRVRRPDWMEDPDA